MARIDVSELMTDPDFISPFTIFRRSSNVNNFGENEVSEDEEVPTVGSVQAASGEAAKRLPDGVNLSKFITIFTKTELLAERVGGYPDQVLWKEKRYNVFQCVPWDNFGAGWYMADCELEAVSV
jgi:hypothetical protein